MAITFHCPACGASIRVQSDAAAGRQGKCNKCHARVVVPSTSGNDSAAPLQSTVDESQLNLQGASPVDEDADDVYGLQETEVPVSQGNPDTTHSLPPSPLPQEAVPANRPRDRPRDQPKKHDENVRKRMINWMIAFVQALLVDQIFRVGIGTALFCLGVALFRWAADSPSVSVPALFVALVTGLVVTLIVFASAVLVEMGGLVVAAGWHGRKGRSKKGWHL